MKRFFLIGIIIICIFTINSLIHSILDLWQKQRVLIKTQQELEKVKKEHKTLTRKLEEVKEPQFIEKEARNKLFVVRPGEKVVVLPSQTQALGVKNEKKAVVNKPHWLEWIDMFWKKRER